MTETKSKNIFQRMSAITTELQTVAKNLEVEYGKKTYKAVSESDVLRAVKPIEAKHGVYSYPYSRTIAHSETITTETDRGSKLTYVMRIETVYRFVNVDNPAEYIDITTYGDGIDSGDKAPGKAMTYADKYGLLKAYKINTGEDPDANHSDSLMPDGKKTAKSDYDIQIEQIKKLHGLLDDDADLKATVLAYYNVKRIEDLTFMSAAQAIKRLMAKK